MESSGISSDWDRFSSMFLLLSRHSHTHTHTHTHTCALNPVETAIVYLTPFIVNTFWLPDKETRDAFWPWWPTRWHSPHFHFTNEEVRNPDSTLELPECGKGSQLSYKPCWGALMWSSEEQVLTWFLDHGLIICLLGRLSKGTAVTFSDCLQTMGKKYQAVTHPGPFLSKIHLLETPIDTKPPLLWAGTGWLRRSTLRE